MASNLKATIAQIGSVQTGGERMNRDFWEILAFKILPVMAGICMAMAIVVLAVMIWRWIGG